MKNLERIREKDKKNKEKWRKILRDATRKRTRKFGKVENSLELTGFWFPMSNF